jgi:hypothetical protein
MTEPDPIELVRAILHEAGHTIIGRALGLSMGGIAINTDVLRERGQFAVAYHDHYRTTLHRWHERGRKRHLAVVLRAQAIMLMAGYEAEVIFVPGGYAGGDDSDRRHIAILLNKLHALEQPASEERLRRFTRQLIRRHKLAILMTWHDMMKSRGNYMDERMLDALFRANKR